MSHDDSFPPGFEQFVEDLFRDDDLGAVVRVHIHMEYLLNEFIRKSLKAPHKIEKTSFEFDQKLDLALALGLSEDLGPPLRNLGSFRNRFAHRLETRLDQSGVKNLYETLSGEDKSTVQLLFRKVTASDERLKQFSRLSELPERNQLALVAALIWSRLLIEGR